MDKIGLIPAAGMAKRLGISTPKELIEIDSEPIINKSINHLIEIGITNIVIVIRKGKELIKEHLEQEYKDINFIFVYQKGKIGNLIDAIKIAYEEIKGCDVFFLLPDTIVEPCPFKTISSTELFLSCFKSETPQNFGTILPNGKVDDKPKTPKSNICWGAIVWKHEFTETIMKHNNFTNALNDAKTVSFIVNIEKYEDIGIKK